MVKTVRIDDLDVIFPYADIYPEQVFPPFPPPDIRRHRGGGVVGVIGGGGGCDFLADTSLYIPNCQTPMFVHYFVVPTPKPHRIQAPPPIM